MKRTEWPFGGSFYYDTPRSTTIALVFLALAVYLWTQSGEYVTKYHDTVPGIEWVVGIIATLAITLFLTGVIYRARQRKGQLGRPARLGPPAKFGRH